MGTRSLGQRWYLAVERGWDGFEVHHVVWTKARMPRTVLGGHPRLWCRKLLRQCLARRERVLPPGAPGVNAMQKIGLAHPWMEPERYEQYLGVLGDG